MWQLNGFSKFRIKVQEAEQENHRVDEKPESRRSPELYLPCEAEKTTAGFHPLHVGSDEEVNRETFLCLVVHAGFHGAG